VDIHFTFTVAVPAGRLAPAGPVDSPVRPAGSCHGDPVTPETDPDPEPDSEPDLTLGPATRMLWRAPDSVHFELGSCAVVVDGLPAPLIRRDASPLGSAEPHPDVAPANASAKHPPITPETYFCIRTLSTRPASRVTGPALRFAPSAYHREIEPINRRFSLRIVGGQSCLHKLRLLPLLPASKWGGLTVSALRLGHGRRSQGRLALNAARVLVSAVESWCSAMLVPSEDFDLALTCQSRNSFSS